MYILLKSYIYLFCFFFNGIMTLSFDILPNKFLSYKQIKILYKNLYKNNDYSLEHIIPQSKLKKNNILKRDMHNILFYPKMINIHRSNYKYTSDENIYYDSLILDKSGSVIDDCVYDPVFNSIKTSRISQFCPNISYRGQISRAALYFLYTYHDYKELILKDVIDIETLLQWHYTYPSTKFEKHKNNIIKEIQGNDNIFISDPNFKIYTLI